MSTFKEVFERITDVSNITSEINNSTVTDVSVKNDNRILDVYICASALIQRKALRAAEETVRKSPLSLQKVSIHPSFPAELFCSDYFFELVEELRRDIPRINGTFGGADAKLDGNVLTIYLKNGGKALLDSVSFDSELTKLIKIEFGIGIRVNFDGVTEIDGDSEDYIEAQNNVEEKLRREKCWLLHLSSKWPACFSWSCLHPP